MLRCITYALTVLHLAFMMMTQHFLTLDCTMSKASNRCMVALSLPADCSHWIRFYFLQAGEEADWHVNAAASNSVFYQQSGTAYRQQHCISLYLIQQARFGGIWHSLSNKLGLIWLLIIIHSVSVMLCIDCQQIMHVTLQKITLLKNRQTRLTTLCLQAVWQQMSCFCHAFPKSILCTTAAMHTIFGKKIGSGLSLWRSNTCCICVETRPESPLYCCPLSTAAIQVSLHHPAFSSWECATDAHAFQSDALTETKVKGQEEKQVLAHFLRIHCMLGEPLQVVAPEIKGCCLH